MPQGPTTALLLRWSHFTAKGSVQRLDWHKPESVVQPKHLTDLIVDVISLYPSDVGICGTPSKYLNGDGEPLITSSNKYHAMFTAVSCHVDTFAGSNVLGKTKTQQEMEDIM
jgi:hypothetical protein